MRIRTLLERAQPGTRGGVEDHIRRGEALAEAIQGRWGVRNAHQWRAKHLRWALEVWAAEMAPATRYHYWRTARSIAAALGRWPEWEPHLRGPWTSPTSSKGCGAGGRPAKMATRAQGSKKSGSV